MHKAGPIGIFDSGYGGLTVFKDIQERLPEYDYIYLGDNARNPYGTRSLEKIYSFTRECVSYMFSQGCHLVILACNTASANALRNIQQRDLGQFGEHKRVLGVIRPTTERLSELTSTGHLGVCATEATVDSNSYVIEAMKYAPEVTIHQQACPLWVPLVENGKAGSADSIPFLKKDIESLLEKNENIDSILLACTHYPLLMDTIREIVPKDVSVVCQGNLVAEALEKYLEKHPRMKELCTKSGSVRFLTTDDSETFNRKASRFFEGPVNSESILIS